MSIKRKTIASLSRHRNRWLYFTILSVVGGLGGWITGFQHLYDSVQTSGYAFCASLGTFSISLAVMSLADLWVLKQNSENPNSDLTRGLAVLLFGVVSAICGASALFQLKMWTVVAAWTSLTMASVAWWGTHLSNPALDRNDALAVLGGAV